MTTYRFNYHLPEYTDIICFALLRENTTFIYAAIKTDTKNLKYGMGCWWYKK